MNSLVFIIYVLLMLISLITSHKKSAGILFATYPAREALALPVSEDKQRPMPTLAIYIETNVYTTNGRWFVAFTVRIL